MCNRALTGQMELIHMSLSALAQPLTRPVEGICCRQHAQQRASCNMQLSTEINSEGSRMQTCTRCSAVTSLPPTITCTGGPCHRGVAFSEALAVPSDCRQARERGPAAECGGTAQRFLGRSIRPEEPCGVDSRGRPEALCFRQTAESQSAWLPTGWLAAGASPWRRA